MFGKNNVGVRVAEALLEKRIAVTHVESTSDVAALAAAGIADAVLCDNLGDNLIRVDRIRDANKRVRIVCRAFHEDAAEVLTRAPFDCVVFSTPRYAADSLAQSGVFREMGIEAPASRSRAGGDRGAMSSSCGVLLRVVRFEHAHHVERSGGCISSPGMIKPRSMPCRLHGVPDEGRQTARREGLLGRA